MRHSLGACFLFFSSLAVAAPNYAPDGAALHDTTEDMITGVSYPDERTMVVNAILTIHYSGRMTGVATYDATYTIDQVSFDACLSGTGSFTGTLDGVAIATTLELARDGLCGNVGGGVIGGIIKIDGVGKNYIQCAKSPLNSYEYLCTYRLFAPKSRFWH